MKGSGTFFRLLTYAMDERLQFLRKQPKAANLRNKKVGLRSQIHAVEGKLNYFSWE